MSTKYTLQGKKNKWDGTYRIVAVRDIPRYGVKEGDLGGRVKGEHNLSQFGDCWIAEDSLVDEEGRVMGDAIVRGGSVIYDRASLKDEAVLDGASTMIDNSVAYGNAVIRGTLLKGRAVIGGQVVLEGTNYLTIGPVGYMRDYLTITANEDGEASVSSKYFSESLEDFKKFPIVTRGELSVEFLDSLVAQVIRRRNTIYSHVYAYGCCCGV